jgi:hypothetical protein
MPLREGPSLGWECSISLPALVVGRRCSHRRGIACVRLVEGEFAAIAEGRMAEPCLGARQSVC